MEVKMQVFDKTFQNKLKVSMKKFREAGNRITQHAGLVSALALSALEITGACKITLEITEFLANKYTPLGDAGALSGIPVGLVLLTIIESNLVLNNVKRFAFRPSCYAKSKGLKLQYDRS